MNFSKNQKKEFYTPEEYFLKHKPVKFEWGSIDPSEILKKSGSKSSQIKEYHSNVRNSKKNFFNKIQYFIRNKTFFCLCLVFLIDKYQRAINKIDKYINKNI